MSYRLKLDPRKRVAGRFIGRVRDEVIRAAVEERTERGLTQTKIAQMLGVDRSQVNRVLKGETNITLRTLADLAWAMDRDLVFKLEKKQAHVGQNEQFRDATLPHVSWPERNKVVASPAVEIARSAAL